MCVVVYDNNANQMEHADVRKRWAVFPIRERHDLHDLGACTIYGAAEAFSAVILALTVTLVPKTLHQV